MDRITLRGIRVRACHGAEVGERDREQTFEVEIVVEIDLSKAAASDDIADTLHYGSLYKRVVAIVRERSHVLLERIAADALEVVFEDPRVKSAEVSVAKPGKLDGATPSITLARPNPGYRGN